MTRKKQDSTIPPEGERHNWPTYWFAALEKAVEQRDAAAKAEAIRQLERLNYRVEHTAGAT